MGALANLSEIEELLAALPSSTHSFTVLIVTAAIMLPVRAFVLFLVVFHAPGVRRKFMRIWPLIFFSDELWSLSPFAAPHQLWTCARRHRNSGLLALCPALTYFDGRGKPEAHASNFHRVSFKSQSQFQPTSVTK